MTNITKTQQFLYLQNKARHYHNLKKSKPTINTFHTLSPNNPTSRLQLLLHSPYRHSINTTHMKQYQQMKINQSLVDGILSIRNSRRPQIYAQKNYSRYNDAIQRNQRNRRSSVRFYEKEKSREIREENRELGEKLLRVRPSIGTMAQWSRRDQANRSLKKIASKYGNQNWYDASRSSSIAIKPNLINQIDSPKKHRKILSIYSTQNKYIPQHYRTFIERDGSTVALRQKMFELPKQIKEEYFRRESSRKNMYDRKGDIEANIWKLRVEGEERKGNFDGEKSFQR